MRTIAPRRRSARSRSMRSRPTPPATPSASFQAIWQTALPVRRTTPSSLRVRRRTSSRWSGVRLLKRPAPPAAQSGRRPEKECPLGHYRHNGSFTSCPFFTPIADIRRCRWPVRSATSGRCVSRSTAALSTADNQTLGLAAWIEEMKLRCGSALAARYWWTKAIAMLPSPTAEATRLTGLKRTSPQAKTPGTLVSSRYGSRLCDQLPAFLRSSPVRMYPRLSRAMFAGQPLGLRVGPDEDEQTPAIVPLHLVAWDVGTSIAVRFCRRASQLFRTRLNRDVRFGAELLDQIVRHALFQLSPRTTRVTLRA